MNLSPESLQAFAQAASCGSLSAAARRLGKSQSTISEAVARLELDLGVELFHRGPRRLALTEAGSSLLAHTEDVLAASDRLARHAARLAGGQEAGLTLALSDAYQPKQYEARLLELDQRFPDLQFESVIAEHADVIDLVCQGRAQLGLLAAQPNYPPHIAHARLATSGEFALFVAAGHPLAALPEVTEQDLARWRLLRLSSVTTNDPPADDLPSSGGRCWAAPDYLMLLDMARLGFGWAELPRQLVDSYSAGALHELRINGWPRRVAVDVVWSRQHALGPVAAWLLERLLADV
ncbi:MAG: LysR family transcriptional regulator [Gammaproteobacteria bacterium]|nr:LysR family transcriptional regulator [Gammaproteobacteria bacterium]MBU1489499.1 LysR family transcriptional regulator [Gammaproteobacteria bacterium]MBU2066740.1 LysR family transcriptional regulator [Gammaproteobacteria bacterium]MBU2137839.1 LysR family transcriptional regulator [Gammaproteobacteria bacterium]MBU2214995.1 LysR family transcriptional regulator [Gammaproteobacteria bacterium]